MRTSILFLAPQKKQKLKKKGTSSLPSSISRFSPHLESSYFLLTTIKPKSVTPHCDSSFTKYSGALSAASLPEGRLHIAALMDSEVLLSLDLQKSLYAYKKHTERAIFPACINSDDSRKDSYPTE